MAPDTCARGSSAAEAPRGAPPSRAEQADALERLADLLLYPGADWRALLVGSRAALADRFPRVAAELALVERALAPLEPGALEELYASTFDMCPDTCLEVGWHLFGETYGRGGLLVELRRHLAAHRVPPCGELPDFVPTVLRLLARLDADDAAELTKGAVRPALATVEAALAKRKSPYRALVTAALCALPGDAAAGACTCAAEAGADPLLATEREG